jgi:SRSO17 transposase
METQQPYQSPILRKSQDKLEGYFSTIGTILGYPERKASFAMYSIGLLSEGERKSAEPIAARAAGDDQELCKKYHDRLCHFLHGSRWDDIAVRQYATTFALKELTEHEPIEVTIVDDTGFLKQGDQSPGVQRQYTGSAGKIANCQVAVSLVLGTRTQHLPIDMDLFLPESWTDDPVRMNKAHVPIDVVFRPKWQIAVDMVERAMAANIPMGVVNADAWYGNIAAFRGRLTTLGLLYAVDINVTTEVMPLSVKGEEIGSVLSVLNLAKDLPSSAYRAITWRQGTRKKLTSRFARIRVCVEGRDSSEPKEQTLLIEWPEGEAEPTHYTLSTLPKSTTFRELVRLTKQRWRTERAYEDMKGEIGLDHFEGRTYPGWQHHISVVLACYAFVLTVLRRSFSPSTRGTSAARTIESSPRATLRRLVHQRTAQHRSRAGRVAASVPCLPPTCHPYVRATRRSSNTFQPEAPTVVLALLWDLRRAPRLRVA